MFDVILIQPQNLRVKFCYKCSCGASSISDRDVLVKLNAQVSHLELDIILKEVKKANCPTDWAYIEGCKCRKCIDILLTKPIDEFTREY